MSLPMLGSTTPRSAANTASFVSPLALLPPKRPIVPHYTEGVWGGQATRPHGRCGERCSSRASPRSAPPGLRGWCLLRAKVGQDGACRPHALGRRAFHEPLELRRRVLAGEVDVSL